MLSLIVEFFHRIKKRKAVADCEHLFGRLQSGIRFLRLSLDWAL